MNKSEKKVLLQHKSGWCIVYDGGFPSANYIVMKTDTDLPVQKHTLSNVAYCNSLESALKCLYFQLIIFHAENNKEYCASILDLHKAIEDAHKDFEQLLKSIKEEK